MSAEEFKNAVIHLSGSLKPYAVSLTRDMRDAEDLMQETILKALNSWSKYKHNTNLRAWLCTIMRNLFINNYRKKVRQNTIVDTSENLYLLNASKTEENKAMSELIQEDIYKEIRKLPEGHRIPFIMCYKGYKYQEIADELDIPLGTVKSRIFLARKQLGNSLRAYRKGA